MAGSAGTSAGPAGSGVGLAHLSTLATEALGQSLWSWSADEEEQSLSHGSLRLAMGLATQGTKVT